MVRVVPVVIAAAVAIFAPACNDRAGTYLVLQSELHFDQVEVFLGKAAGERVPTTPLRPALATEPALLVHRSFLPPDAPEPFDATTEYTYFIPASEANSNLGDYVLVVASIEGRPVAIGELFDFEIATGKTLYRYIVPLVSIANQDVERWGRPKTDCIRWTRARDGGKPRSVAVVRSDDDDCDSFLDPRGPDEDCEPLLYCDGTGSGACVGTTPCLSDDTTQCFSGGCVNRDGASQSCTPSTCVEGSLCAGCSAGDPSTLLACALNNIGNHMDYGVPVINGGTLCYSPYLLTIELPFPCTDPMVEAAGNYYSGGMFTFSIVQKSGNFCTLTITPPAVTEPFTTLPHLLVSIANPPGSLYARSEFVFGLSASSDLTCPGPGIQIVPDLGNCGL